MLKQSIDSFVSSSGTGKLQWRCSISCLLSFDYGIITEYRNEKFQDFRRLDTLIPGIDSVQNLIARNHGVRIYRNWSNASEWAPTKEKLGIVPMPSESLGQAINLEQSRNSSTVKGVSFYGARVLFQCMYAPSSYAALLFCPRSSEIVKSFYSCSKVNWIIARSRLEGAQQEQGESSWRGHFGRAHICMLYLAAKAKGTDRGGSCSTWASRGCSESYGGDTWKNKQWLATTIFLPSRQKLGRASPPKLCRRIIYG